MKDSSYDESIDALLVEANDLVIMKRSELKELLQDRSERIRAEGELHRLSHHLESVREQERLRLSRELHDELGQAVTAMQFDVAILKKAGALPGEAAIRIEAIDHALKGMLDSIRRISSELRPKVLDDLGLGAAIEWKARDFAERTSIRCDTSVCIVPPSLAMEYSTTLYRVFQETLTNIVRHADATAVSVELAVKEKALSLTVADNGKGITEEQMAAPDSFGLLGMRERVRLCNGTIDIRGMARRGSVVRVQLPLDEGGVE